MTNVDIRGKINIYDALVIGILHAKSVFHGDVCKRCLMSCNKKLILVDSSVGISLDEYGKERTQAIFIHKIGHVLVYRAEQAYQPCSKSFRSSTSKILLPIGS